MHSRALRRLHFVSSLTDLGFQGVLFPFCCGFAEKPEYASKKSFLLGESMGGAVAILLSWKEPETYSGAVLVAPMCKVSLRRGAVARCMLTLG